MQQAHRANRNTAAACSQPKKGPARPLRISQGLGPMGKSSADHRALEADREAAQRSAAVFGWALQSLEAAAAGGPATSAEPPKQLAPNGTAWTPDLLPRVDRPRNSPPPMPSACPELGSVRGNWLQCRRNAPADALQVPPPKRTAAASSTVLGNQQPPKRPAPGTLPRLLRPAGYRLPKSAPLPHRWGSGIGVTGVVSEPCPNGRQPRTAAGAGLD